MARRDVTRCDGPQEYAEVKPPGVARVETLLEDTSTLALLDHAFLELRPGDLLLVAAPPNYTPTQRNDLSAYLEGALLDAGLGGVEVAVVLNGTSVAVIRKE